MADNPILKMLLFFKSKKLKQLKYIKNIPFYMYTSYTLSGLRLVMTKFMSFEEIKNNCLYSRYKEKINLEYLSTEEGKELLKQLSMLDYEKEVSIDKYIIPIDDYVVDIISFCYFKQLQVLNLYYTKITDTAVEHLIKCDFKQLQKLYLFILK